MSTATLFAHRAGAMRPATDQTSSEISRLPDVTIGEIVAFVTLLRCGTFTAAARHLHLSQPGMSARIARLERAMGAPLMDRSTRSMTLTPTGRSFAPLAESIVELMATASTEAAGIRTAVGTAGPPAGRRSVPLPRTGHPPPTG